MKTRLQTSARTEDANFLIGKAIAYVASHGPFKDENGYLVGYPALLYLFERLQFDDVRDVRAGAYAVYGWMPTILKWRNEDGAVLEDLRLFAKKLISGKDHAAAIEEYIERTSIPRALNNSITGTSKFLHFVAPELFPIWDSYVALVFSSKDGRLAEYAAYYKAVHQYAKQQDPRLGGLVATLGEGVTEIRKIEFCVFQYGRMLNR